MSNPTAKPRTPKPDPVVCRALTRSYQATRMLLDALQDGHDVVCGLRRQLREARAEIRRLRRETGDGND